MLVKQFNDWSLLIGGFNQIALLSAYISAYKNQD